MLSSRIVPSQHNAARKSRLESIQRPSMLPKPLRPVSNDRMSNDARRPSAGGHRSSSAEPARGTFGGARPSREASVTKGLANARSKSQQIEKYGQVSMTPLVYKTPVKSKNFSSTTPVRTPSQERGTRSWQTSLDRALGFVTVKDERPIATIAWQRAECTRVAEALAERKVSLLRPLTIARFVDIVGSLFADIICDAKLNNDNYVTKLPHLCKRLLYPGNVSKSWLKTVNTLHAFPQALALISYLLDLVNHIEMPVPDEWLYIDKDDVSRHRRDYLVQCWNKFQSSEPQFEDLNKEYLQNLKALLGIDDQKIVDLEKIIKQYEDCLNDEEELAAKAEELRRIERRDALLAAIRAERAMRHNDRAQCDELKRTLHERHEEIKQLDLEIERATVDNEYLDRELEAQPMTVEQRTKMLADLDYSLKVQESKRALAQQVAKMVEDKETEVALWQKKTLDSCLKYNQGLIRLSIQFPDLSHLVIDENELMSSECAAKVSSAVEVLRSRATELVQRREQRQRDKSAHAAKRIAQLEETRARVAELRSLVAQEKEALASAKSRESAEAAAFAAEKRVLNERLDELKSRRDDYNKVEEELRNWEHQRQFWRTKLDDLAEYIKFQKIEAKRVLNEGIEQRARLLGVCVEEWKAKLNSDNDSQ